LWKQRTWAEWLAFVSGTLLLPLEVRELMRGITIVRSVMFAANIGIVLYMFFLLRAGRRRRRELALIELASIEPKTPAQRPDPKVDQSDDHRAS
jgi:hypothetical protein